MLDFEAFRDVQNHSNRSRVRRAVAHRRTYKPFPSELASFYQGEMEVPFKKENVRQSLARAVQTLILATEYSCIYRGSLVNPADIQGLSQEIHDIVSSDLTAIKAFSYPRTCLRKEIRARKEIRTQCQYRSRCKSWNTTKWLEFISINGIRNLLELVLSLALNLSDLDALCKKWGRDCCEGRKHYCREMCREKWTGLISFCRKECGLPPQHEDDSSTGGNIEPATYFADLEGMDFYLV